MAAWGRRTNGFARGELPETHWPMVSGGKIHVDGAFFSNNIDLLCDTAVGGLGIALLPRALVAPHLESGALVQVLAGVVGAELQIALVYPERTFLPPQVCLSRGARSPWNFQLYQPVLFPEVEGTGYAHENCCVTQEDQPKREACPPSRRQGSAIDA
jgi:hypothetical protein